MKRTIGFGCVLLAATVVAAGFLACGGGGGGGGGATIEGKIFFAADNGVNGMEPWSYNGTGSPGMVENLVPDTQGQQPESSDPEYFTPFGGLVYFRANNSDGATCLWATDGGSAWMVTLGMGISDPAVADSMIYFRAWNGGSYGLWTFDGTDFTEVSSANVYYKYMIPFDGKIVMSGYLSVSDQTNSEPFVYDGVTISRIRDVNTSSGSYPMYFTEYDGAVYFRAADDGTDYELWATDGSDAWMATEINSGGSGNPKYLVPYGSLLYFSADDGTNGQELWASDGSSAWMITPEINSSGSSDPAYLTVCNGKLYFSATDGTNGQELWEYDSTLDQLQMVANINTAGSNGSYPSGTSYYPYRFLCLDDKLYFGARANPALGYELYVYDGAAAGLAGGSEMNPSGDFWLVK